MRTRNLYLLALQHSLIRLSQCTESSRTVHSHGTVLVSSARTILTAHLHAHRRLPPRFTSRTSLPATSCAAATAIAVVPRQPWPAQQSLARANRWCCSAPRCSLHRASTAARLLLRRVARYLLWEQRTPEVHVVVAGPLRGAAAVPRCLTAACGCELVVGPPSAVYEASGLVL